MGDVVADGVCHGDPTHGAAARVVEGAKLGEEVLAEAPHLTPIEQDGQHEGRVHLAPEGLREGEVAQHASQGAKGRRRRLDALVDVRVSSASPTFIWYHCIRILCSDAFLPLLMFL